MYLTKYRLRNARTIESLSRGGVLGNCPGVQTVDVRDEVHFIGVSGAAAC